MTYKKTLACLISLITLQSAQANDFSNTIFFGDSLTDSGSFLSILQSDPTYNGVGQFTTNPGPVWSEVLAAEYGINLTPANQGGTNYAEGGARIQDSPGVGSFPATGATPIFTQVQNFLTTSGGIADPNALYTLWGGANDIFWIAGGAVAPEDVPAYLSATITGQVQAIGALQAAGAKYIIVPTLPDIGATPFGASQGTAGADALTTLSKTYNDNLMLALQFNDVSVITADMFTLLNEIQADPSSYGFDNVTVPVCGALSSLLCVVGEDFTAGLEETYLFADGVHPTSGAHQVISDYVKSILEAPAFVQSASRIALNDQIAVMDEIDARTNTSRKQGLGESELWISGSVGNQRKNIEATPNRLGIGFSKKESDTQTIGAGLHISKSNADLNGGAIDSSITSFSLYSGWDINQWQLNGSLTVSSGTYDTQREVTLGTATRIVKGSTDGIHLGAQATLHYPFNTPSFTHGPSLKLRYQRLNLAGFTEKSDLGTSTAMRFGSQTEDNLATAIGWEIRSKGEQWQPYADIEWNESLGRDTKAITTSLLNMPGNSFTLPTTEQNAGYGKLTLGIDGKLSETVLMSAQVNHLFSNDTQEDTRLNLSASIKF